MSGRAGPTYFHVFFFLLLLPHVAESVFVFKASSTLMSYFAHGTSSVSACGSVLVKQVT